MEALKGLCQSGERKEGLLYAELDFDLIAETKMIVDSAGHYARPDVVQLRLRRMAQRPLEAEDG